MKKIIKSKFGTILILVATIALAGIAVFTALRLYKLRQEAVAPSAPTSEPAAAGDQCPGAGACPASNQLLRNCYPPDGDGTPQDSLCNTANKGRVEPCGPDHTTYCCNGTKWTTNMSTCQQASPTAEPSPIGCTALGFSISASSPTPTPIDEPTPSPSPSPSPTSTATSTPVATETAQETSDVSLPEAGTSAPTIIGLSVGIFLILVSLLIAL